MEYGTHLTFLLSSATTVVTVYYLVIIRIAALRSLFMSFWVFAVLAAAIGIPRSIPADCVHLKRSQGYSSEVDIPVEAGPYYFRVAAWKGERNPDSCNDSKRRPLAFTDSFACRRLMLFGQ